MTTLRWFQLLAVLLAVSPAARPARGGIDGLTNGPGGRTGATPAAVAPDALKNIGVDEKLNTLLPADLELVDDAGRVVRLGSYFDGKRKPVILQLGYFGCPMLCDLVSRGLSQSLNDLKLDAGADFEVLFVSFDATETPTLAAQKKRTFLKEYGRPGAESGYHFLTGTQQRIDQLTTALGYRYKWIESARQFSHPAAVMILTPEGRVSRYLYPHGMKFDEPTLRLSLVEASDRKVGSTVDHFMLSCFQYDGKQGRYALAAISLMRAGGALTVLVIATVLWRLFRREARLRRAAVAGGATTDADVR